MEVSAEGKVVVVEVIVAVGREVPSINSIAMFVSEYKLSVTLQLKLHYN